MQASTDTTMRSVTYGRRKIDFRLFYCDRKTLEIAVHPDGTVVVKAPAKSAMTAIEHKIMKRVRWIIRQQNYFKQFSPRTPARCYVNGETHLYLGKQYRLKLIKESENSIKLSGGFFIISVQESSAQKAARILLEKWYSQKARAQFDASLDRCWKRFKYQSISKPKISVRRMKKRWGSLSAKGTLTINADLIRSPNECIDYVVIHELCHLKYNDHSPAFYKLLDSIMPNWEKIKHKLELALV